MIALDHVKPGDLDPTGGDIDAELLCPFRTFSPESEGLYCTRMYSHPGPHVAGDGVEVLAVWR